MKYGASNDMSEVTFHHHCPRRGECKNEIENITRLLLVLQSLNLGIGFYYLFLFIRILIYSHGLVLGYQRSYCDPFTCKSILHCFYFMHLGDEIRNMVMTIAVPLCYSSGSLLLFCGMEIHIRIFAINTISISKERTTEKTGGGGH
jgi:hypothetical protein